MREKIFKKLKIVEVQLLRGHGLRIANPSVGPTSSCKQLFKQFRMQLEHPPSAMSNEKIHGRFKDLTLQRLRLENS